MYDITSIKIGPEEARATSGEMNLQEKMVTLVRAFGLHHPQRTPCGQPVTVSEAHALMEVARGPLPQAELVTRLRLEKSSVSRLVGRLEQRRWLARERDPADGRAVLLQLTEEGRRAAEQLAAARAHRFSRLFAAIPPPEREAVLRTLDVLVRAMNESGGG